MISAQISTSWCIIGSHQHGDCGTGCAVATVFIVRVGGATPTFESEAPKAVPWWQELSDRKRRRDRRRRKAF